MADSGPSIGYKVWYIMQYLITLFRDSFVAVEVTLLDANDNNPVFFPSNIYEFTITSDKTIGTIIGKV